MKFVIERKTLLAAMTAAHSVVERANTIPILSNVLIDARGGMLRLTATDLDMEISLSIAADVSSSGQTTVPAAILHDITRKLPDGSQVECEMRDQRFDVRTGRSKFHLQSLPAEDFPDVAAGEMAATFVMEAAAFRRLFSKCLFAISTEETRYYLNGVYLHRQDDALRAVSTDGHRLAMVWTALPEGAAGVPGVIVPRKTCGLLVKLLDGVAGDCRVGVSANKMIVEFGGTRLVTKLIDGTFPDYERVVPKANNKIAFAAVKDVLASVDRVATIASERGRASRFIFEADSLSVSMSNADAGTAEDSVDVKYDGPVIDIGFNSRYLLDLFGNMGCERVRIELADAGSPTVVKPEDGDMGFLAVLMPMRV